MISLLSQKNAWPGTPAPNTENILDVHSEISHILKLNLKKLESDAVHLLFHAFGHK